MENGNSILVTGASGKQYKFWVYPWGHKLKAEGGVYMVLKNSGTLLVPKYSVIYVGQTENLDERFDDHHKQFCFNRNGRTHIGARLGSVKATRLTIEADLVARYSPSCND